MLSQHPLRLRAIIRRKPRIAIAVPERDGPQVIQLLPQLLHERLQLRVPLAQPPTFGYDRFCLPALALAALGCGDFVLFAEVLLFVLVGFLAAAAAADCFVGAGLFAFSRFVVALIGGIAGSVRCFALGWEGVWFLEGWYFLGFEVS